MIVFSCKLMFELAIPLQPVVISIMPVKKEFVIFSFIPKSLYNSTEIGLKRLRSMQIFATTKQITTYPPTINIDLIELVIVSDRMSF